jgi:hypothetical protein
VLDHHDLGAGDDVHARGLQRADQVAARDRLDAEADALAHLEDRHADAEAGEVLGGLAAGRRAAHDDDELVRRRPQLVAQEALRVVDERGADAGDRRDQRLGAGGDEHRVRRDRRDRLRRDVGIEVDLDAELVQPARLEVTEAQHLALARRQAGDLELAAEAVAALPDRDVVPAQLRDPRRLHAGRAAADDHHPARVLGRRDRPRELAPGLGIDRAPRHLTAADEVHARVAGDAGAQLVQQPVLDLARPVRLGDQRAPEQDEVGVAGRDDVGRQLGVVEPPDGDHRDVDGRLDRGRQVAHVPARDEHRRERHVERVPGAGADADRDCARLLQPARDLHALVEREAARHRVLAVDAPDERRAGGDDRARHLEAEARAVGERAAVGVGAAVVERREEVRRQIAVRAMDLDELEAGLEREVGGARVVVDDLRDLRGGQLVRDRRVRVQRHRRGCDGRPFDDLAAGVHELHADGDVVGLQRLDQLLETGEVLGTADLRLGPDGVGGHEAALDGDRPHAALGAPPVVGDRLVGDVAALVQAGPHRSHDEAVAQGQRPERQRLEQRLQRGFSSWHGSTSRGRWARRGGACGRRRRRRPAGRSR